MTKKTYTVKKAELTLVWNAAYRTGDSAAEASAKADLLALDAAFWDKIPFVSSKCRVASGAATDGAS